MNKFVQFLTSFFLKYPQLEHALEFIIWAGVVAMVGYVKTAQQFEWSSAGMVVLVALRQAVQSQKSVLLAFLQDQVQALMNASPGQSPQATLNAVPIPKSAALSPIIRASMVVMALMFLAGPSFAGYLISQPKPKAGESVSLALPSGTAIYLMPIEGFDVGAALPKPTYGFSLNEDLVLGTQVPAANGSTNLAPLFGLGASAYADFAGVVNSTGPLYLLLGLNAVGPDLDLFGLGNGQGLVPQVMYTHNFITNEDKVTGGLTVFTDLGPGTAQKLTP